MDNETVERNFSMVQAIVSEEIRKGELHDATGSDIAEGYMVYLEEN